MKNHSIEWVTKAEGDFATALRELRARKCPNFDAACFHAQQCIEKLFKAILVENHLEVRKTHDLEVLLDSCLSHHPLLEGMRGDAQLLTQYAVQFRYPGDSADRSEAAEAVKAMRRMQKVIASLL